MPFSEIPFLFSIPGRTGDLWERVTSAVGGKAFGPDPLAAKGTYFLSQFKVSVFGLANQWTFSSIPFSEMSFLLFWERVTSGVAGNAFGPEPLAANGTCFLSQFNVSVFGLANQ